MANHITSIRAGEKAPDFNGKDQNGETIRLKDYKGKKLILFFYPKDQTPTCTVEVCNLRDNFSLLKKNGFAIVGISADTEAMHQKFITRNSLPFPLIADTEMKIIRSYDVWGEKLFMGRRFDGINRTTFVIDEKGKIEQVITKVQSKRHAEQILEAYK
jgi:peroxiredoxin Q/BCP